MDNILQIQEQLFRMRENMIGCKYRHFKGNTYVVTDIAIHSETEELMIIYKSLTQPNLVWCRPMNAFFSEVDHEKYPDVNQILRFERIDENEISMTNCKKQNQS